MKYATLEDIKSLIAKPKDSLSISIFLPTHRIALPHNLKADRIRMKNAIRDIKAVLSDKLSSKEVRTYTRQLERLHADRRFWNFRDNGLALFVSAGKMKHFDLPAEVDTKIHVDENFVITPLLATMQEQFTYYVLELNRHEPRFFIADSQSAKRTLVNELPGDIKHALLIDEYQVRQQHASGNTKTGVSYAGRGGIRNEHDTDLERYLRLINEVLWKAVLHDSNRPLVIMGDISTVEMFRNISPYKYIAEAYVRGSYDQSNEDEIHARTWQIIAKEQRRAEKVVEEIIDRAKARDDQQLLVNNSSIRKAARRGRIGTLIISMVGRTYDSVVQSIERRYKIILPSSSRQLANIEAIARDVLNKGGQVASVMLSDDNHTDSYIQAITRPGEHAPQ